MIQRPTLWVSLLTHNMFKSNRKDLFDRCYTSLKKQTPHLTVFTNGSQDRTDTIVAELGGVIDTRNPSFEYGWNQSVDFARSQRPYLILFTADDYEYDPTSLHRLVQFWEDAPSDVIMATCDLEPDFPWNTATDLITAGGQRALLRDTIPGANMSFRARDSHIIGPMPNVSKRICCRGCDQELCRRLRGEGYKLAALPLAEHTGMTRSAGGNTSWQTLGQPLARKWLDALELSPERVLV